MNDGIYDEVIERAVIDENFRFVLHAFMTADFDGRRRMVDFMSRDPDRELAGRNELRAMYDLPALDEGDEDLPTLIAQWDKEEAGL